MHSLHALKVQHVRTLRQRRAVICTARAQVPPELSASVQRATACDGHIAHVVATEPYSRVTLSRLVPHFPRLKVPFFSNSCTKTRKFRPLQPMNDPLGSVYGPSCPPPTGLFPFGLLGHSYAG
eukprot:SAG31_NODE_7617_length_1639_cov_1.234416_1_plen_122_part_10